MTTPQSPRLSPHNPFFEGLLLGEANSAKARGSADPPGRPPASPRRSSILLRGLLDFFWGGLFKRFAGGSQSLKPKKSLNPSPKNPLGCQARRRQQAPCPAKGLQWPVLARSRVDILRDAETLAVAPNPTQQQAVTLRNRGRQLEPQVEPEPRNNIDECRHPEMQLQPRHNVHAPASRVPRCKHACWSSGPHRVNNTNLNVGFWLK